MAHVNIYKLEGTMLESIRVRNLRSLKDTDRVLLRPLTILLGENSCGKSTFLRTFPLLRQSAESSTRSSILWFGKYVDFGDFDEALIREEGAKEIAFEFGLTVPSGIYYGPARHMFRSKSHFESKIYISLRLASLGKDGLTRTAGVDLEIDGNSIKIDISEAGKISSITVNDNSYNDYCDSFDYQPASKIFPIIGPRQSLGKDRIYSGWWGSITSQRVSDRLLSILSRYSHKRSSKEKLLAHTHVARIGSNEDMFIGFRALDDTVTWRNKTAQVDISDSSYIEYRDLLLLSKLSLLLHNIDDVLDYTFRRVSYIEPVRASAQRYYRSQDLAVSELDSKGENLAMFIRNLSDRDRLSLESWMMSELGLKISAAFDGGHVSLRITFSQSNQTYNLADMGFGFSQVMPVLVQLWTILNKASKPMMQIYSVPHICVIEQPELHLHPRFQAKLAEILVRASQLAKKNQTQLLIILETHSEVIINKVGLMTSDGAIPKEDSSIILFSKSSSTSNTQVEFSRYDNSGSLLNWPFGFFDFEV